MQYEWNEYGGEIKVDVTILEPMFLFSLYEKVNSHILNILQMLISTNIILGSDFLGGML